MQNKINQHSSIFTVILLVFVSAIPLITAYSYPAFLNDNSFITLITRKTLPMEIDSCSLALLLFTAISREAAFALWFSAIIGIEACLMLGDLGYGNYEYELAWQTIKKSWNSDLISCLSFQAFPSTIRTFLDS